MNLLLGIIVMLLAVLVSNIINKFTPQIAAPIIQILLGIGLSLCIGSLQINIPAEILFSLFVAPLVYYSGRIINRKAMWKIRGQIANLAGLLVLISCLIVSVLLHHLIPSLTIAVGIILIASLGPTDDVAINTLDRNYKIPGSLLELLKGESVFNDVSSIIIFQIGLEIMTAGKFSIAGSALLFLKMSIGGVLIGVGCSFLKLIFSRWLCSQGIVNQTTHVLLGVLTPILVYCLAEHMGVSGILAIFLCGLISSSDYPEDNPDVAQIIFSINNFWDVCSFALEGLVFVILGTEIPNIARNLWQNSFEISTSAILLSILICFLALLLIRFLWYELTMPNKKFRFGVIFALSGARGAVTMASVSSIPLLASFLQRDLLITIAMGVVLLSIVAAHFVLPFFVEKKNIHGSSTASDEIYHNILQTVLKNLQALPSDTSQREQDLVLQSYHERLLHLEKEKILERPSLEKIRNLDNKILAWKKDCITHLDQTGAISSDTYHYFQDSFEMLEQAGSRRAFKQIKRNIQRAFRKKEIKKEECSLVIEQCNEYVYQKLVERKHNASSLELERLQDYERILRDHSCHKSPIDHQQYNRYKKMGLQMERDLLQKAFEQGQLSKETLNYMKNNITMLEMQME